MDYVLPVAFTAIFFYVLYCVIKAGTRDGILAARKRSDVTQDAGSPDRG